MSESAYQLGLWDAQWRTPGASGRPLRLDFDGSSAMWHLANQPGEHHRGGHVPGPNPGSEAAAARPAVPVWRLAPRILVTWPFGSVQKKCHYTFSSTPLKPVLGRAGRFQPSLRTSELGQTGWQKVERGAPGGYGTA